MGTEEQFLNFHYSEVEVHRKKDHIKIRQFTKFELLSLDSNHLEGFQKSEQN